MESQNCAMCTLPCKDTDRTTPAKRPMCLQQDVLEGTKAIPIPSRYCDVRDVARAHILAAEVPGANGRYLVSHVETVPSKFVSDSLQVLLLGFRSAADRTHTRHPSA